MSEHTTCSECRIDGYCPNDPAQQASRDRYNAEVAQAVAWASSGSLELAVLLSHISGLEACLDVAGRDLEVEFKRYDRLHAEVGRLKVLAEAEYQHGYADGAEETSAEWREHTVTEYGAVNPDEAAPMDNPLPLGSADLDGLEPPWRLVCRDVTYMPWTVIV